MQLYEYKVVPAPVRGEKDRGLTGAERFALALSEVMNELARDGWEYWRAETLPAEERAGLASKTTVIHHLLVFRRALEDEEVSDADGEDEDGLTFSSERRGRLTAFAPEGRAPRLGPAADETF
ncbi:DUF4177 domain-containing protein [Rhodobacter capsulatus]|uniref:DUF4177 domain-containing protein n=1 Tax=Rhodobacter capsulatus TaxID=1061 RepID=UPI0040267F47